MFAAGSGYIIMNSLCAWKTKHHTDMEYSFNIYLGLFTCLLIILDPEIAQQSLHNQIELIIGENNEPSDCFSVSDAFCRTRISTFTNTANILYSENII